MAKLSGKNKRQYWRRSASAQSWWPWGIVPFAGLGILFLFGALMMAPRIEAEVRDEVSERIIASGLPVFDVRSEGQGVTVSTPAAAEYELYLQALAASTRCETWAGQIACPTTVTVRRIDTQDGAMILRSRPHMFSMEKTANSVTLAGEVPNQGEHDRILDIASQRFDDVTDSLSITNLTAGANYRKAAYQALAVISHLSGGEVRWSGESLTVTGTADADALIAARRQFSAIGAETLQGEFNVLSMRGSEQCRSDFDEILNTSTFQFRTGSAIIETGREDLLDHLAELARSCPGSLTVHGLTDNQHAVVDDHALGLARATVVRNALAARGVDIRRLSAEARGEPEPFVDNSLSIREANNRRIAISIEETQ